MKRYHWILLLLLVCATAFIAYQQHHAPYQHFSGKVFGTFYNITYQSADNLEPEIAKALEGVDASLSMFNQQSTISKINRNESSRIDYHIEYLLPKALKISEKTDGAFDVTVAPLVNAWGFGFKNESFPSESTIDSLKAIIGYKKISINDKQFVKADPRTMIDLSAVAKGYGTDVVAQVLDRAKVQNYMVEIGGEVVVKGKNDKGENWRIGIAHPTEESETTEGYERILSLTDRAMATSGNYRNFYDKDGIRYAHTIDPRTGHPVQQDIISATVLAPHCYEADAYATAFMVLGLEKAKAIIESTPTLDAYLIYIDKEGNHRSWSSTGLK